jgi:hypothetical protein
MARLTKYKFSHLYKTNIKEYNRLVQIEYRKRNHNREVLTPHLILTHLETLPDGVKPVPEWPTYYASADGRIFRDSTTTAKNGHGKIIEVTPRWNKTVRYYQVQPYKPDGKRKLMYVHRMVLAAFTGEMRNDMQVNHINFDRADNSAKNLEWVSFQENIQHYVDADIAKKDYILLGGGRKVSNTKHSHLKSTIKDYLEMGMKVYDIARILKVRPAIIYQFKMSKAFNLY